MKKVLITNNKQSVWAQQMAQRTELPLIEVGCTRFADGEIELDKRNLEAVQNAHAVIVHVPGSPVHDNLWRLVFTVQALKAAQASKITLFMPYAAYSRQPEALQTIVALLASLGVSQCITLELHEPLSITSIKNMVITNITLDDWIAHWVQNNYQPGQVTIVAPDAGSCQRATYIAQQLQAPLMVFAKERYGVNKVRVAKFQGACQTPYALIVDDIIDTGSTVQDVAGMLHNQQNVQAIDVFAVHGLLSGNAPDLLQQTALRKIIIANTIEHAALPSKFHVVDISDFAVSSVIKKLSV